ncbi:MAG: hypothetical protein OIN83_08310 [Candidatus Methanoperedens sp.]|nr:hypothetical protein [Candidatus Methanoperedens sp.]
MTEKDLKAPTTEQGSKGISKHNTIGEAFKSLPLGCVVATDLKLIKDCYSMHAHIDKPVREQTLKLWKKRGFEPFNLGVLHVRYEDKGKKYQYPLYFKIHKEVQK